VYYVQRLSVGLHYFDLLRICCTTSCATNLQQVEGQQQVHNKLYDKQQVSQQVGQQLLQQITQLVAQQVNDKSTANRSNGVRHLTISPPSHQEVPGFSHNNTEHTQTHIGSRRINRLFIALVAGSLRRMPLIARSTHSLLVQTPVLLQIRRRPDVISNLEKTPLRDSRPTARPEN